jgi:hypothetical protein
VIPCNIAKYDDRYGGPSVPPPCLGHVQVFLALLARSYSWELHKPDEVWTYFPLPVASEGMPTTFRPL